MSKFVYRVIVETDDLDDANTAMVERIYHEEEYGFNYLMEVDWEATEEITS